MKNLRKIAALLLLCQAIMTVSAQKEGCVIRKSIRVNDRSWLTVENKYGDISIISDPSDSITVCATITIQQDNKDIVSKSLTLIKPKVEKQGDTVAVITIIDNKFFSTLYSSGRRSFRINYIINVPETTNMELSNAFGDITLDETSGYVKITLSHGDLYGSELTRGNVRPVNQFDLDFVKANLAEVNWLVINARNCQSVSIDNARAIVVTSEFSKFKIAQAGSLVCKSKSDSYNIGSVKNFVAETSYSAIDINNLTDKLQAVTLLGSININELKNGFELVDLKGTYTPVNITTQKDNSYKCNISLMSSPFEFDLKTNPSVNKSSAGTGVILSGTAGRNMETKSELIINLVNGVLRLKSAK